MSVNSIVQKIRQVFDSLTSYSNERKRRAEPDAYFDEYRANKSQRLNYEEYSDTEMDDVLLNFNRNKKQSRKPSTGPNQFASTSKSNYFNGYDTTIKPSRNSSGLPNNDLYLLSNRPIAVTQPLYMTQIKSIGNAMGNHNMRNEVPPLMPLRSSFMGSGVSSRRSRPDICNTSKAPVPDAVPISLYTNQFMSASMQKQSAGSSNAFKSLNAPDKFSRGHQMMHMACNKPSPFSCSNVSSIFKVKHEKNEKVHYEELLNRLCPELYASKKGVETIDLTAEEKQHAAKLLDLANEEKDESTSRVRTPTPPPQSNTLLDRFGPKPLYRKEFSDNVISNFNQGKKVLEDKIREAEQNLSHCRIETDKVQQTYKDRIKNTTISYEDTIYRILHGEEEEEDEIEEYKYRPLAHDERAKIKAAIYGGSGADIIITKFNMSITRNDLLTLCGSTWLNDEVINFYMNLIMQRSEERTDLPKVYCFNTFFIPTLMQRGHAGVKRWTRKVDIFSYDLLPVPVHVGGIHWCMAVIRMKDKIIRYYDSMGNSNQVVLDALERYLASESLDKKKVNLDTSDWQKESIRNCPQQKNGSDCGVFSCMCAEHLSRNAPLSYSQENMPYFREKMVLEIALGRLLM